MKKKAGRAVAEPHKSANQNWYESALQVFWRKFEEGLVKDNANNPYKSKNKGGGGTIGHNARILVSDRKVKIVDIKCQDALVGDCIWQFEVVSVSTKGTQSFKPYIKLQHSREKAQWWEGREHTVAVDGKVVSWNCACWNFKKTKKPCKHILAGSLAMYERIEGTRSGRIKE